MLPSQHPAAIHPGLKTPPDHDDAAWKLVVETLFQPFLALLFKPVADRVDWSGPIKHLDGHHALLLIHVEIQAQRDPALALRMFRYHYRIFDVFGRHPASLVVLADDEPGWRPGPYVHEAGAVRLTLAYHACKLLDLDLGPWLACGHPVARVIQAHRLAQRTRGDAGARRVAKLALVRELLAAGLAREEAVRVLRIVHWLLALPREDEAALMQEVRNGEAGMHDTMRSPSEMVVLEAGIEEGRRLGRQEGRQEGREEGRCVAARECLLDVISERFGACNPGLARDVESIQDVAELRRLARRAIQASSLEDLRREIGDRGA